MTSWVSSRCIPRILTASDKVLTTSLETLQRRLKTASLSSLPKANALATEVADAHSWTICKRVQHQRTILEIAIWSEWFTNYQQWNVFHHREKPSAFFFFVASAFRPVWPGRCIWALSVYRSRLAPWTRGESNHGKLSALRPLGHGRYRFATASATEKNRRQLEASNCCWTVAPPLLSMISTCLKKLNACGGLRVAVCCKVAPGELEKWWRSCHDKRLVWLIWGTWHYNFCL